MSARETDGTDGTCNLSEKIQVEVFFIGPLKMPDTVCQIDMRKSRQCLGN